MLFLNKYRPAILMGIGFLWMTSPLNAAQTLTLESGSSVWLVGDSTLHPFTSRTSDLNFSAALDSKITSAVSSQELWTAILMRDALTHMDISIPVQNLKSGESGLDKNMYKTLKAEQYPTIDFHLTHYDVSKSTTSESAWLFQAAGTLEISGHTQPVLLQGTLSPQTDILHVEGIYTLLMTDYGVKPPTMMMGTIKVKNPVAIHFDLKIKRSSD